MISRPDICDGRTAQTRCHQLNGPASTLSSETPGHTHPSTTDCTLVDKLTRACFGSRGCAPLQPPRARDRIRPSKHFPFPDWVAVFSDSSQNSRKAPAKTLLTCARILRSPKREHQTRHLPPTTISKPAIRHSTFRIPISCE